MGRGNSPKPLGRHRSLVAIHHSPCDSENRSGADRQAQEVVHTPSSAEVVWRGCLRVRPQELHRRQGRSKRHHSGRDGACNHYGTGSLYCTGSSYGDICTRGNTHSAANGNIFYRPRKGQRNRLETPVELVLKRIVSLETPPLHLVGTSHGGVSMKGKRALFLLISSFLRLYAFMRNQYRE